MRTKFPQRSIPDTDSSQINITTSELTIDKAIDELTIVTAPLQTAYPVQVGRVTVEDLATKEDPLTAYPVQVEGVATKDPVIVEELTAPVSCIVASVQDRETVYATSNSQQTLHPAVELSLGDDQEAIKTVDALPTSSNNSLPRNADDDGVLEDQWETTAAFPIHTDKEETSGTHR